MGQPIPQRILAKRFYAPAGENGGNLDKFFDQLYEEFGDFRIIGVFPMNGCERSIACRFLGSLKGRLLGNLKEMENSHGIQLFTDQDESVL